MADDSSTVSIVFKGSAQSVEDAIKRVSGQLGSLDRTATETAGELHKTAAAENEVEREAKGMLRGMEVAADGMALFSKESSEAARHLYEVRSLATDMRGAFSNLGSAIVGGAAAFAGVAAIGFFSGAVKEALAGEQAQAKLNAALKGNKDQIEQVNKSAEDGATTWAKYGLTVGQLKGVLAGALGRGLDPRMILGNASGVADLAVALGTKVPGAIDAVTNGPRSLKALGRALNLNQQELTTFNLKMQQAQTAAGRFQVAMQYVEHSRFAGQGDALANTDLGKIATFQNSMKDLQETLGTTIIPLMGNFANAINGMVGSVNSLLGSTHGLSDLLSSKWVPIIALSLVGLKGFLGVVNLIEGLFRTKFVSTLMGTRQEIDQGARATADYVKALDDIPPAVDTTASFVAAQAMTTKDAYIANIQTLMALNPVITNATFSDAAALAAVSDYKGQLATIPGGMTTTASGIVVPVKAGAADTAGIAADEAAMQAEATAQPVSVPVTAGAYSGPSMASIVGATALTATVSTVIFSPQARDALGSMFKGPATITGWNEPGLIPPPAVKGKISGWTEANAAPPAPVKGKISGWSEPNAAPPHAVKGKISGWTEAGATPPAPVRGKISGWDEAAPTPPKGVKGHITSWTEASAHAISVPGVVKVTGHVTVDNATANITKIGVPSGLHLLVPAAASINGVQVPHGTTFVVNGTGRITQIVMPTGPHGKPIVENVPLHAKVQVDAGALSSALGTSKNPLKMYVQPVLPKGYHPTAPTTPPQQQQGGGALGGIGMAVIEAVISGVIMSKMMSGGKAGDAGFMDKLGKALYDAGNRGVANRAASKDANNANADANAKDAKFSDFVNQMVGQSNKDAKAANDLTPAQVDALFGALEPTPTRPVKPGGTPPTRTSTGPKASDTQWNTSDIWDAEPAGTPKGVPYVSTRLKTPMQFGPKRVFGMNNVPDPAGLEMFVSGFPQMMQMLALVGANRDTARYKTVYGAHGQVEGYRGLTAAENKAADKADATHLQSQWSWLTGTIRNLVYTPLMAVVNGIKGIGPAIGSIITGALSHIPGFGLGTNKNNPAFVNGQWIGTGQNAYRTHDANLQGPPSAEHGFAREFLADKNNQNGSWFYIRNGQHPPTGWHQTGGTAGFLRATGGLTGTGGLATTLADIISQSGGTKGGALGLAGRGVGHTGNITINQTINGGAHDPQTIAHAAGIEARKVLQEFVGAL